MRILLPGSSGWLGRVLAPGWRGQGHQVIGLDVAPGADTEIVGSVADRALVERVSRGIDAVIHAGALHKPDIVRYPESALHAVNIEGTRHLPAAAPRAGAPHNPASARYPESASHAANTEGPRPPLPAAAAAGAGRFLFTST